MMVVFVMVIMMVTIIDGTAHHDDDDAAPLSASRRFFGGLFVCLVHGCLHTRRDEFSKRSNVGLDARGFQSLHLGVTIIDADHCLGSHREYAGYLQPRRLPI